MRAGGQESVAQKAFPLKITGICYRFGEPFKNPNRVVPHLGARKIEDPRRTNHVKFCSFLKTVLIWVLKEFLGNLYF